MTTLKNAVIFIPLGIVIILLMEPASWFETLFFNYEISMKLIYFKMGAFFALGAFSMGIGAINLIKYAFETIGDKK